jgi:flagellar hook-length control protein FliK
VVTVPSSAPGSVVATDQPSAASAPSAPVVAAASASAGTAAASTTAASSTAPGPGGVPTDGPAAAPVAGPAAQQEAGAGASDTGAGSNAPTTSPVAGAPSGPAPTTPVASPREAAGATGAATAQAVGTQVARHVAVLRGAPDGTHSMTLVLTPETLGRVEIHVTVSQGTVDLTLRGAHEHGRAALVDALPDLRRDLETAGLACSRLAVDRDTGSSASAQQQAPQQWGSGERGGAQHRADSRPRSWVRPADTGEGRTEPAPATRSTSRGVDYRV